VNVQLFAIIKWSFGVLAYMLFSCKYWA